MTRIISAVILALLFHVALLRADIDWFYDKKVSLPKNPAVMITMSYRKAEPILKTKKPPKKIKKTKKEPLKAIEKPKPVMPEKAVKTAKVIPVTKEIIAEQVKTPDEREELAEKIPDNINTKAEIVHEAVPLYKINPTPKYPMVARKRGYEGIVLLSVLVNKEGLVDNLWVFESSGYKVLDNAAIESVQDWIFEPGMRGIKKVEMWVQIPVGFKLE